MRLYVHLCERRPRLCRTCSCLVRDKLRRPTMLMLVNKTDRKADKTHFFWLAVCDQCSKEWFIRKGDIHKVKWLRCLQGGGGKPRTNWRNYSGQTIGYLQLEDPAGVNDQGLIVWNAVCTYEDCRKHVQVSSDVLRKSTVSCGCCNRKQTRLRALAKYKGEKS